MKFVPRSYQKLIVDNILYNKRTAVFAAIQIVDEQHNRDGSRGVKEISPTARAVLNQRTYRRPGYANTQETQTAD